MLVLDTTTPHTTGTAAKITITGICTDTDYTTSDYTYYGDSIATAYGKINTNFSDLASQITAAAALPNYYNTTLAGQITTLQASVTALQTLTATNAFPGSHILNASIPVSKVDSSFAAQLATYMVGGGLMNFDSGAAVTPISSDGNGTVIATSLKGGLLDNSYSAGTAGYVAVSNGDSYGNWTWSPAPSPPTMSFDTAAITSDGSGNIVALSIKSGLKDSGYSGGTAGYVPVSAGDGDGNWTWTALSSPPTMSFDSASITSDGSGQISAIKLVLGSASYMTIDGSDNSNLKLYNAAGSLTDPAVQINSDNVAQFNGQYFSMEEVSTQSTDFTVDWNVSNVQYVTVTGDCVITLNNAQPGGRYALAIVQDGTGGHTISFTNAIYWVNGAAPTPTGTAGSTDIYSFVYFATTGTYYGMMAPNFG